MLTMEPAHQFPRNAEMKKNASVSRPLLVAVGWCLGKIGDNLAWPTKPNIEQMAEILSLIECYRDSPPGGQMCYAFSELPLLNRDAFAPARAETGRSCRCGRNADG